MFRHTTAQHPRVLDTETRLRYSRLSCSFRWQTDAENSPVHLKFDRMPETFCGIVWTSEPMSRTQTLLLNIASIDFIAKWDWQSFSTWCGVTRFMTDTDNSPVYVKVVELCLCQSFAFEMHTWPQVSGEPKIGNWCMIRRPSLHYSQHSTHAIYLEIGQPGTCNVAYLLTSSNVGH